jgi:predicted metal-dependent HD superfamily phosphohydrolase
MESILQLAADYVTKLFNFSLPQEITYHNLTHIKEAVKTVKEIGIKSKLRPCEIEVLLLAAWFHDIGMVYQYNDHEEKSAELCRAFLSAHDYSRENTNRVVKIILSTRLPQQPKNLLEQIMCDADLSYIGKKKFDLRSQQLREEWKNMLGKNFSDYEWLKANIDFLLANKFHTKSAKSLFDKQRKENLAKLQKKILRYKITPPPKHKSSS